MTANSSPLLIAFALFLLIVVVDGLGSASTLAAVYGTGTACGIMAGESTQRVLCCRGDEKNTAVPVPPEVSFQEISGGRSFFCGLRRGGLSLLCWDTAEFRPKRIYHSDAVRLADVAVGDGQVCALEAGTGVAVCWRRGWGYWSGGDSSPLRFSKITCGSGFVCGVLRNNSRVFCWGNRIGDSIQSGFGNSAMLTLVAGDSHACGLTVAGALICRGDNGSGQLNAPAGGGPSAGFEFSGLALGANFTCAIRTSSGLVACWGGLSHGLTIGDVSLESIVAGLDFVCGLKRSGLGVVCWGPGWPSSEDLPIGRVVPGPCVRASCGSCGAYADSEALCGGSGRICKPCPPREFPLAAPLPAVSPQPGSRSLKGKRKLLLFLGILIVGSVGSFVWFWCLVHCLWSRIPTTHRRDLNRTREPNTGDVVEAVNKLEKFSLSELAAATRNFSAENRIGSGSFGVVYRGSLSGGGGREVAVKRGHSRSKKSFHEKELAFESELAVLSRLSHEHLVPLLGFCDESDERLLVYEYMPNGSLHHHLHGGGAEALLSWKTRIRIALEAARGIQYLHDRADPPVIHRDIKSSNILLGPGMTAKVSDFGLSREATSGPGEAAGTPGYIDPEYYVLNVLTTKSDVYGLGVVMLELLTGKRAVFRAGEGGEGAVTGVVEYAAKGVRLDERVTGIGDCDSEARAVEVMAATAMRCVSLEGHRRPEVAEVVASLETAFSLCP